MEKLSVQDHTTVRTDVTTLVALVHSCLRHENKLIEYQIEALRTWNDLKSPKRKAGAEVCLQGIIFNLAGSSDGLSFKLLIVQMPTKKVLLWDCLCLVTAFISFHVTDDLASGSSHYLLPSRQGRFVTCRSRDLLREHGWLGREPRWWRWQAPEPRVPRLGGSCHSSGGASLAVSVRGEERDMAAAGFTNDRAATQLNKYLKAFLVCYNW